MATPLAVAWHRVHAATGPSARLQRATATLEVVLRLVAVIALADYLRGPPDPRVEQHLEKLARPALGTWLGLARDALRAVHERPAPAPFVPEAWAAWFEPDGRPGDVLRRLDALVAQRNQLQHGAAVGGDASDAAHAATFVDGLREVLASVHWLLRYRLLAVVDQAPTRAGTARGRVQLFTGQAPPEPVAAEWTARLFADAVYLCTPAADAVLELSPLVAVLPEPQLGVVKPFVLHGVHRSGDVVVACDETGHTERVRPQHDGAGVPFAAWLAGRGGRDPVQANRDVAGTLSSALGAAPAATGELAGRFRLGEQLGEGGMAVVYRAHDRVADAPVAVKMLRPEVAADPEIRARFKREAATMAAMRHPRVLSGVSIGEAEGGVLFIAMPLFEGGTVADRIAAGTVGPAERARWTRQLLEALVHLAEQRVVHRDVKPSNLLLDASGDVVLADFGIALGARDARLTRTLTQLGSLAYMAPESRTGEADAASDAYAAAVVLHELHTGALPRALPGDGVEGRVGEVIRALGALDPADRPTPAAALAALDDVAAAPVVGPKVTEASNDVAVLVAAAVAGLVTAVLMAVPAATAVPARALPDWPAALPDAVAWSAWGLAAVGWGVAGAAVGRRAAGDPVPPGAAAGALAALVAFGLGGAPSLEFSVGAQLFDPVRATDSTSVVLSDALLRMWWGGFGVGLLAPAVGAACGAAGAWAATRGDARPPSRAVPDLAVRITAMGPFVAAQLQGVAVAATFPGLSEGMSTNAATAPGLDLLLAGAQLLPTVSFTAAGAAAAWAVRMPLRDALRSARRDDRWVARAVAATLTLGPLAGLALIGPSALTWVLAAGAPVGAAIAVEAERAARTLPTVPTAGWSQTNPSGALAAAAVAAVTLGQTYLPLHVGLAAAMLLVPAIIALQGYGNPPDPATAVVSFLKVAAGLGAAAPSIALGTAGASAVAGAVAWRFTGADRPAAARAMLGYGLLALGAPTAVFAGALAWGVAHPPAPRPPGADLVDDAAWLDAGFATACAAGRDEALGVLACPLAGWPVGEATLGSLDQAEAGTPSAALAALARGDDPAAVLAGLPADAPWAPVLAAWLADQYPDAVSGPDPWTPLEAAVGPRALVDALRVRAARRDRGAAAAVALAEDAVLRHPESTGLAILRVEVLAEAGDPAAALAAAAAAHDTWPWRLDVRTAWVATALLAADPGADRALDELVDDRQDLSSWDEARLAWALAEAEGPVRARGFLRAGIDERTSRGQRGPATVLLRALVGLAAVHPEVAGEARFAADRLRAELERRPALAPWATWAEGLADDDPDTARKAWPALGAPATAATRRVPCAADLADARHAAATGADLDALPAFAARARRRCALSEGRSTLVHLATGTADAARGDLDAAFAERVGVLRLEVPPVAALGVGPAVAAPLDRKLRERLGRVPHLVLAEAGSGDAEAVLRAALGGFDGGVLLNLERVDPATGTVMSRASRQAGSVGELVGLLDDALAEALATTSPGASVEAVRAVVAARSAPDLLGCWNDLQARGGPARGDVQLGFRVVPSGRAVDVALVRDGVGDPTFAACVQARVADWVFPASVDLDLPVRKTFSFGPATE